MQPQVKCSVPATTAQSGDSELIYSSTCPHFAVTTEIWAAVSTPVIVIFVELLSGSALLELSSPQATSINRPKTDKAISLNFFIMGFPQIFKIDQTGNEVISETPVTHNVRMIWHALVSDLIIGVDRENESGPIKSNFF